MAEEPSLVEIERRGHGVVIVAMNRPEARNALSRALIDQVSSAFAALAGDRDLRTVILTGVHESAFCAGADLRERQGMSPAQRSAHTEAIGALADAIAAFPTPVIAAIQGYALAGGMELALACDLRIASTTATFGLPEVKIGIFPGAGGVVRLPRLIGPSAARDLIFTGRRITADEAFEIGLVDRLVAPGQAGSVALEIAEQIAANAPLAIRAVKQALWESEGLPERSAHRIVQHRRRTLDDSRDYNEGLAAFAEKREPRFTGR